MHLAIKFPYIPSAAHIVHQLSKYAQSVPVCVQSFHVCLCLLHTDLYSIHKSEYTKQI